jgi:hypothetical protein
MKSHINAVAKSIAAIKGLSREMQASVLHKLVEDGHVVTGDGLHAAAESESDASLQQVSATGYVKLQTLVEASRDANKQPLIRSILRQFRQLGVDVDPDEVISTAKLDIQLKGKDINKRLKLKQDMALIGLIA